MESITQALTGSDTLHIGIALWCVLAAALMPYVFTFIAKFSGGRYNNYEPRKFLAKLEGFRQRSNAAQMNSFEIFPFFAVAVLVALLSGGDTTEIDQLALIFIGSRVVYGICYIANLAILRSLVWFVGMTINVMLFTIAV